MTTLDVGTVLAVHGWSREPRSLSDTFPMTAAPVRASHHDGSPIVIRTLEDDEDGYVVSHWCMSMMGSLVRRARRGAKLRPAERDRKAATEATTRRLASSQRVLVADDTRKQRGASLVGFICYTPLRSTAIVHYVYVAKPDRRGGIGRRLLAGAGVDLERPVMHTHVGPGLAAASAGAGVRLHAIDPQEIP